MRIQINTTWNGLDVTGELIKGDVDEEGMIDTYLDDYDVCANGESLLDWLTEEALDSIEQFAIDEYEDRGNE